MKIVIGGFEQPTRDGSSVSINRAVSDPVPTASVTLTDNSSSITVQAMQEIVIFDDQVAPYPTSNLILDPAILAYVTYWSPASTTGLVLAQLGGSGGVTMTCTNVAIGTHTVLQARAIGITSIGSFTIGQTYMLSATVQGSSSPTNFGARMLISWLDGNGSTISQTQYLGAVPVATNATRISVTSVAPANAVLAVISIGVNMSSNTNSGVITYTQIQFEPTWFSSITYPTPFCGPSQTNCTQWTSLLWYRQYRKFAGFVTHASYGNYHGNVRDIRVDAAGYAWILGTILCNNSYSSKTDAFIIGDLLSSYMPSGILTTTNVIAGITLTTLASNWDDLRTIFDKLASSSGFYWTIDYYWNAIYAPYGYFTMPISLICDHSSTPNMSTTYPAYDFGAEMDFTQPGCSVLVLGSSTNVSKVIDPASTAQLSVVSGYLWGTGIQFQRKINDGGLQSTTDTTQRGIAEVLQYDYPRNIYRLKADVELLTGYGIAITSCTDGLNASTLLLQSVSAQWLGTSETLQDTWEYSAVLGAVNRAATSMISRIYRATNMNTAATAIAATALVVFEKLNIVDAVDANSAYALAVLADAPNTYYRLGEPSGFGITTAYDWSGNAYNGSIAGTVTLGLGGALYNDPNTSMTFDGSSGYIATPLNLSGATAQSFECWVKPSNLSYGGFPRFIANADNGGTTVSMFLGSNPGGAGIFFHIGNGTTTADAVSAFQLSTTTWAHVVGTWDGTTMRLYINGVIVGANTIAGPLGSTAYVLDLARTTSYSGDYWPGYLDEVAIYSYALSAARVLVHYTAGVTGR